MDDVDLLRTAQALKQNKEKILALWGERARQEIPAADGKSDLVLRDALPQFLGNLVRALSPNEPDPELAQTEVSKEHAEQRDQQGDYSLRQVLAEYFILQKTIFEVLEVETGYPLTGAHRDTILESMAIGIQEAGVKFAKLQTQHLERSNDALAHFAHIASHDLQEPLRAVSLHLSLVQRSLGKSLEGEVLNSFNFVLEAARRMKQLIDSLLIYSQLGQVDEKRIPTDFNESLKTALANLQTAIKESGAVITADPLPTIFALPIEIERLFQNLIGNALKFRGEAPPRIHISAVGKGKNWFFSVSDNGIGIPQGEESRIFKIFARVNPQSRAPGSGIGLSVCRRVVELHGGAIWYDANPEGGTTFHFSIPEV